MIVNRPRVTCESPEPDLTVIRSPVVPYYSAGEEHYKYIYNVHYIVYIINLFCLYCGPISAYIVVLTCSCPKWRFRVVNTTDGLPEDTRDLRGLRLSGATWSKHARMVGESRRQASSLGEFYMHNRLVNSKLALTMHV